MKAIHHRNGDPTDNSLGNLEVSVIPRLTPIVPTRKMSEAIAFVCRTCGSVIEENPYWPLAKSVGLHSRNGRCTRKDIVLLAFQATREASKHEAAS